MSLNEPVPDIRSLDLLKSVAELRSIRQAAFKHLISQPAASMRLRTLERTLDLELLDRSHGRAELTPAGIAVVQWSKEVLEAMNNLKLGAQALGSDEKTHLRLVASMTVAEYLVPGWLHRLHISDPTIMVSLQMGNSQKVIEVSLKGDAEIGFVEGHFTSTELSSRIVRSDDLVVVVSPSSPWARRKKPLTAKELSGAALIVREKGSGTREVLEIAMQSLNLPMTTLVELGSTTAIKAAVASGVGPGVLGRLAVETDTEVGRLVVVPTEGLSLERSIRMVWSKGRPLSASAKRLVRQIDDFSNSKRVP